MKLKPEDQREHDAREKALKKCLDDKSRRLSSMYYGALETLRDSQNPDRFALAAHGLRELMEKLPSEIEVDMPAHRQNMGEKVRELFKQWEKAKEITKCRANGSWQGPIDSHLGNFLGKVETFFDWLKTHIPRRKEEVGQMLDKLDGAGQRLPEFFRTRNVENWDDIHEFFKKVSHHGKETNEAEFAEYRFAIEYTLLNLLQPRPFVEHDELDVLMGGGGNNANS